MTATRTAPTSSTPKTAPPAKRAGGTPPPAAAQTWRIEMTIGNSELYRGTYSAGETRRAITKAQSIFNRMAAGTWTGGIFRCQIDGPALPAAVKRS